VSKTKTLRIFGVAMVVIGALVLVWDAYALTLTGGFQNDAPPYLTYSSVGIYGVLLIVAGIVTSYISYR
jgi:hypothetical protein